MTKGQLVDVMMKHKERFSHIKPHTRAKKAPAPAPAPAPKKKERVPFKIKEKKKEKVPFKIKKKVEVKAKTPTPKLPTPKAKTPSPKLSNEKKVEEEIFDDGYEDWKYHSLQWDVSYEDRPFRILMIPALFPEKSLPTYQKIYDMKTWQKEQEDDHTANNLMDIAHSLLYQYDNYQEFLDDFKKKMPEYFKYFIQYYRKEAKVPIGDEKIEKKEASPSKEEENEKLANMLREQLEENSEQRQQIETGRKWTRYGYLTDITEIKDKQKQSQKTKIINLMRKIINAQNPGKKARFTGFTGKTIESLIRRALKVGVKASDLFKIWDNYVYFQSKTDF